MLNIFAIGIRWMDSRDAALLKLTHLIALEASDSVFPKEPNTNYHITVHTQGEWQDREKYLLMV